MKLIPHTFRIFVRDLEEAKAFYRDKLDWGLSGDSSQYGYLVFEPGNITVVVERTDEKESEDEGGLLSRFTGLSLGVENLHTVHNELKDRGVVFTGGPEEQSWGGLLAWIKDPDGNILTLIETKA